LADYTHTAGAFCGATGLAVGEPGAEVNVFDNYGNLVNMFNNDGMIYYVDVNAGVDTNNGLSWGTAFKTLAVAFAASNATIVASTKGTGRGWAARNTIYFKGDNDEAHKEVLITLPNKCDVIGVGSYDHHPFPILIGNHVIGAGAYMGTRFINMGFRSPAAGGVIMTVPTTTSGPQFLGCCIMGDSTTPATKGILATGVEMLKIKGCRFMGAFSAEAIELGAGESNGLLIEDNIIQSGAVGILASSTLTCTARDALIRNNTFDVATITVNDLSGKILMHGNRGRSAGNGKLASTLVFGTGMAVDNQFAHAAGNSIYPVQVAIVAP
jgi:hypothetical protein